VNAPMMPPRLPPALLAEARRQALAEVSRRLQALNPEHREVVMLVCVEEHSYKEAADVLQIPVGTVMSRLARARLQLQEDPKGPAGSDQGVRPSGDRS